MTTTHAITDIHKAEEKATNHIAAGKKTNDKKIEGIRVKEEKSHEAFMGAERETGKSKIEVAKKEASQIMKDELVKGEKHQNDVMTHAKEKSDQAVDDVVKTFMEYVQV